MSTARTSRRRLSGSMCASASGRWGLAIGQVFVPQTHTPARTAEVDWGQAEVQLAGSQVKVHVFVMRSCFSGAAFAMASPVETQQAFLEGHASAFDWFAGVFEEVRYDNLGSAVKKVLRGRKRVEADRFISMRSHYLFESIFTTPGIEGAHEKGGVEGEVGRFRRNHLVPVPSFGSFAQLNAFMLEACESDLGRRIDGRPGTVGEQFAVERPLLRLIERAFDATELSVVRVDAKSLVTVRQNKYSVPASLAGLKVTARSARPRFASATARTRSPVMSACTANTAPGREGGLAAPSARCPHGHRCRSRLSAAVVANHLSAPRTLAPVPGRRSAGGRVNVPKSKRSSRSDGGQYFGSRARRVVRIFRSGHEPGDLWACDEAGDDCLGDYAVGDAGTRVGGLYQPWLIWVYSGGGEHLFGELAAGGRVGELGEPASPHAPRERQ